MKILTRLTIMPLFINKNVPFVCMDGIDYTRSAENVRHHLILCSVICVCWFILIWANICSWHNAINFKYACKMEFHVSAHLHKVVRPFNMTIYVEKLCKHNTSLCTINEFQIHISIYIFSWPFGN